MSTVMLVTGLVLVAITVYLLVKGHDARVVLIGAGIIMCAIGGVPMNALDAFAKSMTNAGLIKAVCSVMGFAMVMRFTGCDKHLINAIANVISKVRPLLIPGVVIGTYLVNIALPSAADYQATELVRETLRPLEIDLLDHVVVSEEDYVSMKDNGFLRDT